MRWPRLEELIDKPEIVKSKDKTIKVLVDPHHRQERRGATIPRGGLGADGVQ
jgi:hypothetical protein